MTLEVGFMGTVNPSGKVRILDFPIALPAKCTMCGASDNNDGRKYIDFGFELDFYGVIYFCTHCISEIAKSLGYISESNWRTYEDEIKEVSERISRLEVENVKLRTSLSYLDFIGTKQSDNISDSTTVQAIEPEGSTNSKSSEQINESGYTDFSTSGNDELSEYSSSDEIL